MVSGIRRQHGIGLTLIITQPNQKLTFILPSHGGWKAQLTQALPKAVYYNGFRDKHQCPEWD